MEIDLQDALLPSRMHWSAVYYAANLATARLVAIGRSVRAHHVLRLWDSDTRREVNMLSYELPEMFAFYAQRGYR